MKKKNGFISMTLVYTFLILFMFLMLAILRTYTEKNKFLQAINDQINRDIGIAKGSRVTIINRLLEDNMPNSDLEINYFKISNSIQNNKNGFFYMDNKDYEGYDISQLTDENADGYTSRLYFFRGDVENNHLILGKSCFRIIRTNEDGSIRVVYNGPANINGSKKTCTELKDENFNFNSISIGTEKFNTTNSVEYVKVINGSLPEADSTNEQSPIILKLNDWYRKTFIDEKNYTEAISKNTVFCNNKKDLDSVHYQSIELAPIFINPKNLDVNNDENIKNIINFNCVNNNDRFSVKDNNILYPVGLLTAQDIVLAGGYLEVEGDAYQGGPDSLTKNTDFYLFSENSYWTMTPFSTDGKMIYFDGEGVLKSAQPTNEYQIRPVISINANSVIAQGNGTANKPYIVRED